MSTYLAHLAESLKVNEVVEEEGKKITKTVTLSAGDHILERIENPFGHYLPQTTTSEGELIPEKKFYWRVKKDTKIGMGITWWDQQKVKKVRVIKDGKEIEIPLVVLTKEKDPLAELAKQVPVDDDILTDDIVIDLPTIDDDLGGEV